MKGGTFPGKDYTTKQIWESEMEEEKGRKEKEQSAVQKLKSIPSSSSSYLTSS